jgi:sec-independent protein translocase protein TatB
MLDFSFGELALIALVALLVVGPKDLPVVLRTVGRWVGQCKGIADEFKEGFKSAMQDSEFSELHSSVNELRQQGNYIRDLQGNLQRTYDIPDFLEAPDPQAAPKVTVVPAGPGEPGKARP